MLDLNDMRSFAAVVEQGSFNAAAQALGMPNSSLSRRIAQLEDRLGVRLLQRSTRSFAVTELGQSFYQHCRGMMIEAQAAQDVASNALAEPCGTVQLACPITLLHMQVAGVLADYMQRYPQVQVKVMALNRAVDVIGEGLDLALRVRDEPLEDSELALRQLGTSEQWLVASPALIERLGPLQAPKDLRTWPSLAQAGEKTVWQLRQGEPAASLNVTHQPRMLCSDIETLKQAAESGLGVAQLPVQMVQEAVAQGRLQRLLPDWEVPGKNIHAVFPTRRGQLPAVRALLDMLAEAFAQQQR